MTSVEIPYSIACALPSLTVIDITNDVSHELARDGHKDGIAYISPADENQYLHGVYANGSAGIHHSASL